jgi:hypothetical protein
MHHEAKENMAIAIAMLFTNSLLVLHFSRVSESV